MAATDGSSTPPKGTDNPYTLSNALMAFGFAWRDADPDRALEAMHRGLRSPTPAATASTRSHLTPI